MKSDSFKGETIWVIGASSGIGHALALELASQGASLVLSARSEALLQELQENLPNSSEHSVVPVDVSQTESLQAAIQSFEKEKCTIHRVIFMAALYQPMNLLKLDLPATEKLIDVNITGAFRFIYSVLPFLKGQSAGGRPRQIVLCASVAGYRGLPNSQPYGATKAALIHLAESLYMEAKPFGIDVKLINPGFVETPLTEKNDFDMPFVISAKEAAQRIARGLKNSAFEIHFPRRFSYLLKTLSLLPSWIYLRVVAKTIEKT